MSKVNWWLVMASTGIVALIIILFLLPVRLSSARSLGQWDRSDPFVRWYRTLMMPTILAFHAVARKIPTSPDSPMPVTAKNSNALSIGFTYAAVGNLRDCDGYQRRPSDAAVG